MTERNKIDELVKSRHSGLSGIGCFCNALGKKDSGQAGMTIPRSCSAIYKSVKRRGLNSSDLTEGGFTLLEIMISLAIIGGLLVTVIYTLNYHLSLAERQEFQTTATMLSKNKMLEAEKTPVDSKGEFPEPYADYSYATAVRESPYLGVSVLTVAVSRGNEAVKLSEMIETRPK